MNAQLEKRLREVFKLNDEQVVGIGALGVENAEDMAYVTEADLTTLNIPVVTARRIIAEFAIKTETVAQAQGTQHITVSMPKTFTDMSVGELLTHLAENPADEDAYAELTSRDQYREVTVKTEKVVVVTAEGVLNVTFTQRYWQYLKKGKPQRRFQGMKIVTLEKGLGRVEKMLYHPLVAGEKIYMGVDSYGCDWKAADRERMEAAYWARTTGHKLFPANVDPLVGHEELIAEKLNQRWSAIVEDYRDAVDDRGAQVSLVVTEGWPGRGQVPFRSAALRSDSGTRNREGGIDIGSDSNVSVDGDFVGRDKND